jgi:hypothetical protein
VSCFRCFRETYLRFWNLDILKCPFPNNPSDFPQCFTNTTSYFHIITFYIFCYCNGYIIIYFKKVAYQEKKQFFLKKPENRPKTIFFYGHKKKQKKKERSGYSVPNKCSENTFFRFSKRVFGKKNKYLLC